MTLKNIYLDQFIKVVERAAYGASKFRGKNDKISADQAAVDEMRTQINKINIKGRLLLEKEKWMKPQCYLLVKMWAQELVKKSI